MFMDPYCDKKYVAFWVKVLNIALWSALKKGEGLRTGMSPKGEIYFDLKFLLWWTSEYLFILNTGVKNEQLLHSAKCCDCGVSRAHLTTGTKIPQSFEVEFSRVMLSFDKNTTTAKTFEQIYRNLYLFIYCRSCLRYRVLEVSVRSRYVR